MIRSPSATRPQPRPLAPADHCARACRAIARIAISSCRTSSRAVQQGLPRGWPTGRRLRRTGKPASSAKQRCRGVSFSAGGPRASPPCRRALAEQLLHPADRITLLIEVLPDLPQQIDVFRPIIAPAATALERFDLREIWIPRSAAHAPADRVPRRLRRSCERRAAICLARRTGAGSSRPRHLKPTAPWPQRRRAVSVRPPANARVRPWRLLI